MFFVPFKMINCDKRKEEYGMKQKYETLSLELIVVKEFDVITASGGTFTEQGFDFGDYFGTEEGGEKE